MDKDEVSKIESSLLERMKKYSKKQQERLYLEFYSAYSINLVANPKEAKRNEHTLASIAKFYGFTEFDVGMLRIRGDLMFASVKALIGLCRLDTSIQK